MFYEEKQPFIIWSRQKIYFKYFLKILFCHPSFVFLLQFSCFLFVFLQKKHEMSLGLLHLVKSIFADIRV